MNAVSIHQPQRIGLFGGTFNPIHIGHLKPAIEVLEQFDLSRIFIIPSALPPHKIRGELAGPEDRYEMVRLAVADHPRLNVSDVEIRRPGTSYTIDTIRHFKSELPLVGRLFFILGMDAFLEINTWKSFSRLLEEASFIVMARPWNGISDDTLDVTVESLARMHISKDYHWSEKRNELLHPHYKTIHLARVTPIDIASSQIRQMICDGEDISSLVSPAVAHYIQSKGLYR